MWYFAALFAFSVFMLPVQSLFPDLQIEDFNGPMTLFQTFGFVLGARAFSRTAAPTFIIRAPGNLPDIYMVSARNGKSIIPPALLKFIVGMVIFFGLMGLSISVNLIGYLCGWSGAGDVMPLFFILEVVIPIVVVIRMAVLPEVVD